MARSTFGGTTDDSVEAIKTIAGQKVSSPQANIVVTFWSAKTGGTQYTDLLLNGAAATSVTSDTNGQLPEFSGPDGIASMWADAGGGRVRINSNLGPTDAGMASLVVTPSSATGAALAAGFQVRPQPQINNAFQPGVWNRAYGATGAADTAGVVHLGTAGSYNVIGIDTTLDMPYCRDDGNGVLRLCTTVDSSNRPTAWSTGKGFPTDTTWSSAVKIVTFKGKLYMLSKQDSTGLIGIWSATPTTGNTALTWDATPLVTGVTGTTARASDLNTDGTYLYWAEYGDPTGGPSIRRSSDGTTWNVTKTFTGFRHIHAVKADPFNPGNVWLFAGDGVTSPNWYSTDHGATWTACPSVNGTGIQLTDMGFTATDVWAADDTAYVSAATIDKTTKQWAGAAASFHGLTPHPAPKTSSTFYDGATTSGSATFTSATAGFKTSTTPFAPTDVGCAIRGAGIQAATTISAYTNSTTVTLSKTATATATGVTFTIDRRPQTFAPAIFYGDADSTNGVFYMTTEQSTVFPDGALFGVMGKGATPALLDYGNIGNAPVYLWRDRVFYGPYNRQAISMRRAV